MKCAGPLALLLTGCAVSRPIAVTHMERGDNALAREDVRAALVEFQQAVKLDPQYALAHSRLGQAYKRAGELSKAADSLQTAVRLDPFHFDSFFSLGDVYTLLNQVAYAVQAYVQCVKLKPQDFESRFRLAMCYHQQNDLSKAIPEYQMAVQLDPRNAVAWSNLGAAQDASGSSYEAIKAYKRALECDSNQPLVLVNLATVYINQDRFSAARMALEAALKQNPSLSVAHERLGYCHWREQRLDLAAACYQKAMQFDEGNARAFAGYGVVRMTQHLSDPVKLDLRDQAVEAWHRSLEIDAAQPKLRDLIEKYRVRGEPPVLTYDR